MSKFTFEELTDLLLPGEAAAMLGVSEKTLANWRIADAGPSYMRLTPGEFGRVRYFRASVQRFIEEERKLMDTKEAALAIGVAFQLLDRRRNAREFPECLVIGYGSFARIRYRREDVERWVESRKAPDLNAKHAHRP